LAALDHNEAIPYPDITSKELAQQYIGLDMVELNKEKTEFLRTIVPRWLEEADARQKEWDQ